MSVPDLGRIRAAHASSPRDHALVLVLATTPRLRLEAPDLDPSDGRT